VIASKYRAPAASAALANGAMSHVLDFDDTHNESFVHVGPPVIPAALAMGERQKVNGKTLITAIAAGMETAIRVGMIAPGQLSKIGFHPTSIWGIFGAYTAASKILQLKNNQIVNGFGVCGSQSAGILEFFSDGSWVKQFHPGWAAHSGIVSALMTQNGMTGPKSVFEGRFGVYKTHLGQADLALQRVVEGLGQRWEIPRIAYKPYPCGVVLHPFLYCASKLKKEHRLDVDNIKKVKCTVPSGMVPLVCEPAQEKVMPRSVYDGRFSLYFTVAAMLVDGKVDISTFSNSKIGNKKILELARNVEYQIDPNIDYPKYIPGDITVEMKSGENYQCKVNTNPGGPDLPMTKNDHIAKFRSNTAKALPRATTDRILDRIDKLEHVSDIRSIMRLCA